MMENTRLVQVSNILIFGIYSLVCYFVVVYLLPCWLGFFFFFGCVILSAICVANTNVSYHGSVLLHNWKGNSSRFSNGPVEQHVTSTTSNPANQGNIRNVEDLFIFFWMSSNKVII